MKTVRNVLLVGCLLLGFAFIPVSADDSGETTATEWTIDWIDMDSHKMVAGDRTLILSPGLRVYSADGRPMSPESLKRGMKVTFEASELPNATHPVVREVRVVSQR